MDDIIEAIKEAFYLAIVILWLIGNVVWGFILHGLAAITPWDVPVMEKVFRPYGFDTTFEVAERNGWYLNPISVFTYTPEKYPEVARKLEEEEQREMEEIYEPDPYADDYPFTEYKPKQTNNL